jgi:hypothetical protein
MRRGLLLSTTVLKGVPGGPECRSATPIAKGRRTHCTGDRPGPASHATTLVEPGPRRAVAGRGGVLRPLHAGVALHPPRSEAASVRRAADVLPGECRRLVGVGANGTRGNIGPCAHSHLGLRAVLRTLVSQRRTQERHSTFPKVPSGMCCIPGMLVRCHDQLLYGTKCTTHKESSPWPVL